MSTTSHPFLLRDRVASLRRTITEEVFKAFGLSPRGWLPRLLTPLVWLPAHRFAQLAITFEEQVSVHGFRQASRWLLTRFIEGIHVEGENDIPREEALLVLSNHPGAYDAVAIAAHLPRNDLKIVITGIPFTYTLPPATARHLIHATREPQQRMTVLRQMVRWLQEGHSVLIFPSGGIDPDPAVVAGASQALENWSPSVEFLLRQVPKTQVLVTAVSGVLHRAYVRSPLVRLRKARRDRQRIAEFLQVMYQMISGSRLGLRPWLTFAPPLHPTEIDRGKNQELRFLPSILAQARQLLEAHQARWPTRYLVRLD